MPSPSFSLGERIGSGAFGEVFVAEWSGIHCAAKKLSLTVEESRQIEIQKEISILHQLCHRNVIRFHATHAQKEDLYLIMDLAEKGDLTRVIKRKTLDWKYKTYIAHEVARGLEYIHSLNIIHSDLKSGNVLLTKHMEVKLCDFGLSQVRSVSISKSGSSFRGTIRWMAPELFAVRPKYSAKSDIYALGMVMWEMAADCTTPFKDHVNSATVAKLIMRGKRETVPEDTPDMYRQLLEQCWDQDPASRPVAHEITLCDYETIDVPVGLGEETNGQPPFLHGASESEHSLARITTNLISVSRLPLSITRVQMPKGFEGHELNKLGALLGRADESDAEAKTALAVMYKGGIGVSKDDTESFKWHLRAAEQGSVEAQFKTGCHFEDGRGTRKDEQRAAYWFHEAAKGEHSGAQFHLGRMHQYGRGVEQDYDQAVSWYQKSADQGNAAAQNNLGLMYQQGFGVKQDYSQAVAWYRKSADQRNADAQNNLGWMYQQGYGVERDYSQAVEWYRKSAYQGDATAQNNLGWLYQKGLGVQKSFFQAEEWYEKSAKKGNAAAQNNLGWIHEQRWKHEQGKHEQGLRLFGFEYRCEDAVAWYRESADQGNASAQYNLGRLYQLGHGVPQDFDKALSLYRKSANQGDAATQSYLGWLYMKGIGVTRDYDQALSWFRKSAEQGDEVACYYLGQMYFEGCGVKRDKAMAKSWFQKSGLQGRNPEKLYLSNLAKDDLDNLKKSKKSRSWFRRS